MDVPPLQGRVNDLAQILVPATRQLLEESLARLEQEDSTQIVVLTVPSLDGDNLETFSLRVFEQWRLGQKDKDNGALLLIAVQDRKIRIEVGYGLEDRLTDLLSGRIIRNEIAPAFRQGDYNQGVINGVAAMIQVVQGAYNRAEAAKSMSGANASDESPALMGMVLSVLLIGSIFSNRQRLATVLGGLSGMGWGLIFPSSLPFWFLGIMGALAALVFTRLGALPTPRSGRGPTRRWQGGSGGGFGGGGFGGGGGSGGGGGASGGW
ncbi:MAG: TPM domain-containing protein [Desulfobulbaceae bacterium]|nr:TPM domain-containing protein [Desulfobulbaceae bacterium]